MFQAREAPREVSRVHAARPGGDVEPCAVTGWADGGPVPAYAAHVFDSGEGSVLLVYGGDEGVRLKPAASTEPWDVANPRPVGRAVLAPPPRRARGVAPCPRPSTPSFPRKRESRRSAPCIRKTGPGETGEGVV